MITSSFFRTVTSQQRIVCAKFRPRGADVHFADNVSGSRYDSTSVTTILAGPKKLREKIKKEKGKNKVKVKEREKPRLKIQPPNALRYHKDTKRDSAFSTAAAASSTTGKGKARVTEYDPHHEISKDYSADEEIEFAYNNVVHANSYTSGPPSSYSHTWGDVEVDDGDDSTSTTLSSPVFAHVGSREGESDDDGEQGYNVDQDLRGQRKLGYGFGYGHGPVRFGRDGSGRERGKGGKWKEELGADADRTQEQLPPKVEEDGEWIVLDMKDDNGIFCFVRYLSLFSDRFL